MFVWGCRCGITVLRHRGITTLRQLLMKPHFYHKTRNHFSKTRIFIVIAHQQWLWLEKQYPYVTLVAFVIMPDHSHALINILHDKNPESTGKKHSILELIGAYKTTSSKLIHLAGCSIFKWQRSYYRTLIYKQEQIDNIIKYINNNPAKWYASKKSRT